MSCKASKSSFIASRIYKKQKSVVEVTYRLKPTGLTYDLALARRAIRFSDILQLETEMKRRQNLYLATVLGYNTMARLFMIDVSTVNNIEQYLKDCVGEFQCYMMYADNAVACGYAAFTL